MRLCVSSICIGFRRQIDDSLMRLSDFRNCGVNDVEIQRMPNGNLFNVR
jgi:hypothetical protein